MPEVCWLAALVGTLAVTSAACGDGKLTHEDFDRSCEVDSDCVIVEEIGFCCSCEEVSINRGDLASYEEAAHCGDCGADCPPASSPSCNEGSCEAVSDLVCTPDVSYPCAEGDCPNGTPAGRPCLENGKGYGTCKCT